MTSQLLSVVKLDYSQMTSKSRIQSRHNLSQSLQSDLDLLSKWLDEWLLRFNIDKCHAMNIDRKRKAKHYLDYDNKRGKIAESEVEKDLGIWVSNDLKWETQSKEAAAHAMSVLGMIRRTFLFVDEDGFKLLYTVYIRPHLKFLFRLGRHISKNTLNIWRRCSR